MDILQHGNGTNNRSKHHPPFIHFYFNWFQLAGGTFVGMMAAGLTKSLMYGR